MTQYRAVVEIPKGSNRRIHLTYDGIDFIDLGLISNEIPINEGVMPVCYGYIENTMNSIEKDNVDVIIFSSKSYKTKDKTGIEIVGMLNREDGDHKIIATDGSMLINDFSDIKQTERSLILEYFGYKSKIISVDNRDAAMKYLKSSIIKN